MYSSRGDQFKGELLGGDRIFKLLNNNKHDVCGFSIKTTLWSLWNANDLEFEPPYEQLLVLNWLPKEYQKSIGRRSMS